MLMCHDCCVGLIDILVMLLLCFCISLVCCMSYGLFRILSLTLFTAAGINVRWRTTEMVLYIQNVIVSVVPSLLLANYYSTCCHQVKQDCHCGLHCHSQIVVCQFTSVMPEVFLITVLVQY